MKLARSITATFFTLLTFTSSFQSSGKDYFQEKTIGELQREIYQIGLEINYIGNYQKIFDLTVLGQKRNFEKAKELQEELIKVTKALNYIHSSTIADHDLCEQYKDINHELFNYINKRIEVILNSKKGSKEEIMASSQLELIYHYALKLDIAGVSVTEISACFQIDGMYKALVAKRSSILLALKTKLIGSRGQWEVFRQSTKLGEISKGYLDGMIKKTSYFAVGAIAFTLSWEYLVIDGLAKLVSKGLITQRSSNAAYWSLLISTLGYRVAGPLEVCALCRSESSSIRRHNRPVVPGLKTALPRKCR